MFVYAWFKNTTYVYLKAHHSIFKVHLISVYIYILLLLISSSHVLMRTRVDVPTPKGLHLVFVYIFGDNLISWSTKRQPTLSWSNVDGKYHGVTNVVSESCWLRNLLLELHCLVSKATLIYYGNVRVVYLSLTSIHQCTKHIEMNIHFKRTRGQVCVLYVPFRYQIADIFTKGLPR